MSAQLLYPGSALAATTSSTVGSGGTGTNIRSSKDSLYPSEYEVSFVMDRGTGFSVSPDRGFVCRKRRDSLSEESSLKRHCTKNLSTSEPASRSKLDINLTNSPEPVPSLSCLDLEDISIEDRPKSDDGARIRVKDVMPKSGRITGVACKPSYSMGYRADCPKCRDRVPGHYSHISLLG
ncbi:uncharacterized protein V1516DRAFT_664844 [Lipomyces oligophaga]|uniref:uncharacterized protein n=1 Tax=Lipomyces oligophaga TaxID=45792 RepID=UPI0034CF39D6